MFRTHDSKWMAILLCLFFLGTRVFSQTSYTQYLIKLSWYLHAISATYLQPCIASTDRCIFIFSTKILESVPDFYAHDVGRPRSPFGKSYLWTWSLQHQLSSFAYLLGHRMLCSFIVTCQNPNSSHWLIDAHGYGYHRLLFEQCCWYITTTLTNTLTSYDFHHIFDLINLLLLHCL